MVTVNRLPITKARINLGQIARRAHNSKEYFILEKDGIPVIGIMAADELEDYLELRDRQGQSLHRGKRVGSRRWQDSARCELLAELKRCAIRKTASSTSVR